MQRPSAPVAFLGACLVAYIALCLLVETRDPPMPLILDLAYLPFRATLGWVCWLAGKRSDEPLISRGWRYLGISQAFGVILNATWVFTDLTGRDTNDLFYIGMSLPMSGYAISGFWQMMRPRERPLARSGDWIDAALLVVAGATIAWYFIAAGLVTAGYDTVTGLLLFFFDSASNAALVLFAAAVWLRAPRGLAPLAMPLTMLGLLAVAAGDLVIERQFVTGTYHPGSFIDIWYAAAVFVLTIGADQQLRNAGQPHRPSPLTRRADVLVFGALVASVLPLAVEVATTNVRTNTVAASGLGVLVMMLLLLWRQRLDRHEIERLIAGRIRLEQQLWQAQKLDTIGRLAGGVAHDFNNILAAISAHAQLLRDGASTAVGREAAEIQFATERAAVIVRRLLTFSGAAATGRKPVVLGDVVASMQPMLHQLALTGATLEFVISDSRATVALADGQAEQILLNLVVNARDATPPSGRITVTTRRLTVPARSDLERRGIAPGAWAVLEVSDTGIGMDRDTQARLFEPFFTTKSTSGGTGLGLATVAGIVHAADGHVLVDSAPGRGTTMTVYLPLVESGDPEAPVPVPGTRPAGAAGTRILVVDDELPIRGAVARYLSRLGYRVLEAADVPQAMSLMEQHDWQVHLVLTDIRMPDSSGVELAARLRARHPTLPVLFMSGHADGPLPAGSAAPPREDVIDKPFDLAEVAERVRARLAAPAA
jgi:signal transduction histidine kinase